MTHDYKRNGHLIRGPQCLRWQSNQPVSGESHQGWLRFYGWLTMPHPIKSSFISVQRWLKRHPRFHLHGSTSTVPHPRFTPTSASRPIMLCWPGPLCFEMSWSACRHHTRTTGAQDAEDRGRATSPCRSASEVQGSSRASGKHSSAGEYVLWSASPSLRRPLQGWRACSR